jgi:hypothetical protein
VAQIFRKLETDSVLVSDRLAGHKEKFYRVADRVFVHFYNVRVLYHGAERSVLAPILDFLVSAFTEDERVGQAERLLSQGLREGPSDASERMDRALACIAGAGAWERMAPQMDEAFWTVAAAQSGEDNLAEVLGRVERAGGRPAAYAVFHGAWTAMGRIDDEEDPRARIMRALLTNRRISSLSAGLLTDIVGTLDADAPGRFDAEAAMLRDFARFNAAGRDPAVLASLNPDVATALRLADPSLEAPDLAVAAPRKGAGRAKRAAKTRRAEK